MSTVVSDLPREPGSAETAPLRFVTAASLFDGHAAAINIMRRLIQSQGVEVIHLGHNRSVDDIVRAAIQEDADGIAVSSYQGGHNEFFRYMIDRLNELGAGHIRDLAATPLVLLEIPIVDQLGAGGSGAQQEGESQTSPPPFGRGSHEGRAYHRPPRLTHPNLRPREGSRGCRGGSTRGRRSGAAERW